VSALGAWMGDVIRELQVSAGQATFADIKAMTAVLEMTIARLPAPRTLAERLMLRSVLEQFAQRLGNTVHRAAHYNGTLSDCEFDGLIDLEAFWVVEPPDAIASLNVWAARFADRFTLAHPPSCAERAAQYMYSHFDQPLSLSVVAKRTGCCVAALTRSFREKYHTSPRAFQRLIRVAQALKYVSTDKIEVVAMRVGYRSPKNFYRAVRAATGLTPSAFRQLSAERRVLILDVVNHPSVSAPLPFAALNRHMRALSNLTIER
jgi:AraC-like DNA-binding protein